MTVGQLKKIFSNLNDDVEIEIVYNDNLNGCNVEDLYFVAPGNDCELANQIKVLYLYSEGMRGEIDD